jgi:hypothetical protein
MVLKDTTKCAGSERTSGWKMPLLAKVDQTCWSRSEAAGVKVERREMILEIDMQPLATGGRCVVRRQAYELGRNPSALIWRGHLSVEQKCVIAAIPGDVHESHECAVGQTRAHPAKTM